MSGANKNGSDAAGAGTAHAQPQAQDSGEGFKRGDKVRRKAGSYEFPGVVLAAFGTTLGLPMVAVEHAVERGMVHVFRAVDIKHRGEREEVS
jgi:hypothetical protein